MYIVLSLLRYCDGEQPIFQISVPRVRSDGENRPIDDKFATKVNIQRNTVCRTINYQMNKMNPNET